MALAFSRHVALIEEESQELARRQLGRFRLALRAPSSTSRRAPPPSWAAQRRLAQPNKRKHPLCVQSSSGVCSAIEHVNWPPPSCALSCRIGATIVSKGFNSRPREASGSIWCSRRELVGAAARWRDSSKLISQLDLLKTISVTRY